MATHLKKSKTPSKKHIYHQLETVRVIAIVKSTGTKFANGISNQYEFQMPEVLRNEIQEEKYVSHMQQLNRKIKQYWPCQLAYYCGYIFVPLTFGLSLLLPKVCIDDAEMILRNQIAKINKQVLLNSKLEMRLVKTCFNSHLVIEERDFAQFELGNEFTYL